MIGDLLTAGRLGYAWLAGQDAFANALAGYAVKLALRSRAIDDGAGERMVELMRADAPQLTGRLVNGITWRREGDSTVVEASAVHESGGAAWDYAPYVEAGTSRMAAEPFFYADAEQVLAERGDDMATIADPSEF